MSDITWPDPPEDCRWTWRRDFYSMDIAIISLENVKYNISATEKLNISNHLLQSDIDHVVTALLNKMEADLRERDRISHSADLLTSLIGEEETY